MTDHDPTDAEIDAMLDRIGDLTALALADHPQRARAVEMLEAGGHLFCRPVDDTGRFQFVIGWFADPRVRPPDVDPAEFVPVVTIPRRVILGGRAGVTGGDAS